MAPSVLPPSSSSSSTVTSTWLPQPRPPVFSLWAPSAAHPAVSSSLEPGFHHGLLLLPLAPDPPLPAWPGGAPR